MKIEFTVDAERLNDAFKMVSIVAPQANKEQKRGYLFTVESDKDKPGLGICRIYSKSGDHEIRTDLAVYDVQGDGMFVYPADYTSEFNYVTGPMIFKATAEDGVHSVQYKRSVENAPKARVLTSFDPNDLYLFDKDIQSATSQTPTEFNIQVLRLALGMAKSFMVKPNEEAAHEAHKTIQIFGADNPELAPRANGFLHASNRREAFYFYSDLLMGKSLTVPGSNLALLEAFLAQSSGTIRVYKIAKGFYVINEKGDVLGWPHYAHMYDKFTYYAKTDPIVLNVFCKSIEDQLQYMKACIPRDLRKIRFHFVPKTGKLWFSSANEGNIVESPLVRIKDIVEVKVEDRDSLVANVNVNQMLHLFENLKGECVELRILILKREEKDLFMFRTIDTFYMSDDGSIVGVPKDAHVCKVTRFTPGMD